MGMARARAIAAEIAATKRWHAEFDRVFNKFVAKLDRAVGRLEVMGENDMGLLTHDRAKRFHDATEQLRKLTDKLRKPVTEKTDA